ncbi:MAG: hypothetical protein R3C61_22760 [Bacteroidia bacterium]
MKHVTTYIFLFCIHLLAGNMPLSGFASGEVNSALPVACFSDNQSDHRSVFPVSHNVDRENEEEDEESHSSRRNPKGGGFFPLANAGLFAEDSLSEIAVRSASASPDSDPCQKYIRFRVFRL